MLGSSSSVFATPANDRCWLVNTSLAIFKYLATFYISCISIGIYPSAVIKRLSGHFFHGLLERLLVLGNSMSSHMCGFEVCISNKGFDIEAVKVGRYPGKSNITLFVPKPSPSNAVSFANQGWNMVQEKFTRVIHLHCLNTWFKYYRL